MSKFKEMKESIIRYMKSGDKETRDILRTLVGELQAKATREKLDEVSDTLVEKTVKSFKENAETCLAVEDNEKLRREISIYENLLPTYETVDQIKVRLADHTEALKSAAKTGPATGMAVGILKKLGCSVLGKDVSAAVMAAKNTSIRNRS